MKPISETDFILNADGSAYHIGLQPDQIPERIIGVGDPERVELVSNYFDRIDFKMHRREFVSHRGTYKGKDILVISTGIGTDNVEIVVTELDALVNVDWKTRLAKAQKQKLSIVRVGTSGALQEDIPAGSEVATAWAIGLDNLMTFYKTVPTDYEQELSQAIRKATGINFNPYISKGSLTLSKKIAFDMLVGFTVTCPGFYAPQGRSVRLQNEYPNLLNDLTNFCDEEVKLTNFEMETAGYYALGNLLGHDVLSVSAILVNRPTNEFAKNPEAIVDSLIKKVLERI